MEKSEKLQERAEQIEICLKSNPIEISQKPKEICLTANLSGTPMIEAYHGCGKGTAYINDKVQLVAWHYGYEQPSNVPPNTSSVKVELSCTQVCFF